MKEALRTNKPLVQGMFMNSTTAFFFFGEEKKKASEAHIYLRLDLLGNMNTFIKYDIQTINTFSLLS